MASVILSEKIILMLLVAVLMVALGVILLLSRWLIILTDELKADIQKEKGVEAEVEEESILSRILKKSVVQLNDAVPIENEEDIVFEHEYDGIRELDNNLPPWWRYLFYLSMVFAVVYLFHYHVIGSGSLPGEEYEAEMAQASLEKEQYLKKAANLVDESTVEVLTDNSSLTKGKSIYDTHCVACHLSKGEGGVGPNFTDEYWLHGGDIKDLFKTIKYGVPAKGMISWQTQLKPRQMQQVASYILTFQGTNPPNQKEPQGEKYVPES